MPDWSRLPNSGQAYRIAPSPLRSEPSDPEPCVADEILHGRLELIHTLVTCEGEDAKTLKRAFREAVDDYLRMCEEEGREPDVPLKGSFNVRPGRELHRLAMLYARREGMTLNAVVTAALRRMLERGEPAG